MRFEPQKLIEGCLIASYTVKAHVCYIYIRGEYFNEGQKLQQAIFNVGRAAIGSPDVEVRGGSVYGQDGQGGAAFGQKAQPGNTEYDKRLNKSYTHKSRY